MNRDSLQPSGSVCPSCGGSRLKRFAAQAYDASPKQPQTVNIVECEPCAWAWQYPLSRDVGASRVVFEAAYKAAAADTYFDPTKRTSVARLQRDFLMQRFAPKSLLDMGCGDGTFATEMASAGCVSVGLDPSLPEDKVTHPQAPDAKLTLLRGGSEALDELRTFDVVTLWDVIEHVPEPLSLIRAAARRLNPGGWLVVETGNFQSKGRIESSTKWWAYQLDHRWYFAPPQLRDILGACGLGSIEIVDRVLRPWWKGQARTMAPGYGSLLRAALRRPNRFMELLQRHAELTHAARDWPEWSGLEITTLLARREP